MTRMKVRGDGDPLAQPSYKGDEEHDGRSAGAAVPIAADTLGENAGARPARNEGAVRGSGAGAGGGNAEDNPIDPAGGVGQADETSGAAPNEAKP